jgi:hypothetical protein
MLAQTLNQILIHGDLDLKLQEFKLKMMTQVVNILSPFLAFALAYNQAKFHNMLVIMLDPCFKNTKVIWDFVGNAHAIQIVIDYDTNIMCIFIKSVFSFKPY